MNFSFHTSLSNSRLTYLLKEIFTVCRYTKPSAPYQRSRKDYMLRSALHPPGSVYKFCHTERRVWLLNSSFFFTRQLRREECRVGLPCDFIMNASLVCSLHSQPAQRRITASTKSLKTTKGIPHSKKCLINGNFGSTWTDKMATTLHIFQNWNQDIDKNLFVHSQTVYYWDSWQNRGRAPSVLFSLIVWSPQNSRLLL